MDLKPQKYRKLCGRSSMSVQSAHLGEDHLLIVDGQFTEFSKRLYYSDIEAILVCPTKGGSILALFLCLFGIPMMLSLPLGGADYVLLFICGVVFSLFGVAIMLGKGSVLFGVKTAVQTVILTGVKTRRKASKVEVRLAAEIEKAQGALSVEELQRSIYKDADRYGTRVGGWSKQPAASSTPTPVQGPPPIRSAETASASSPGEPKLNS